MIRKATVDDVVQIKSLIEPFAKKGLLLPRSLNSLYTSVRDFFVIDDPLEKDRIIGCCSLAISWQDLGEIRTLAVRKQDQKKHYGLSLVKACIEDAKKMEIKRLFTLTYSQSFFEKIGFVEIDKSELPHKIWADCINCPDFPECREKALIYHI